MTNEIRNCIEYFQPPKSYFWQWAEHGQVIEWTTGKTICYKAELESFLTEFIGSPAPPLSTVLLVIDACKGKLGTDELRKFAPIIAGFGSAASDIPDTLVQLYNLISNLPKELHSGNGRKLLLHHIFKAISFNRSAAVNMTQAVDVLGSQRWEKLITNTGSAIFFNDVKWHISYLEEVLRRTPTTEKLEQLLRTGLDELPSEADISIPDTTAIPLLQQLAETPDLAALSRLAERLIPVINVPIHVHGSGDMPLGGISDITNKGNYDKLLLSELAHDDITLMARLVNGEALYFRREEPPDKPTQSRVILIDVTIKMWGIPRLFAMAAALAFVHNCKTRDNIAAFTLEGTDYTEADLHSVRGVTSAMSKLHHSLHCGVSLQQAIAAVTRADGAEIILITDEQSWSNAVFMSYFSKVKDALNYIITVNRSGGIEFKESILGKTKRLGGAKLDLADILTNPVKVKSNSSPSSYGSFELPLFYHQHPKPLLFPKNLKGRTQKQLMVPGLGLIAVNSYGQALLLKSKSSGAIELIDQLPAGEYAILYTEGMVHVLVCKKNNRFLKLFSVRLSDHHVTDKNLSDEMPDSQSVLADKQQFYIETSHARFWLDPVNQEVSMQGIKPTSNQQFYYDETTSTYINSSRDIDGLTFPGYSVMFKTKQIFIDAMNQLVFGSFTLLSSEPGNRIRFWENREKRAATEIIAIESGTQPKLGSNKRSIASVRYWKDGSRVLIDPKGVIHLTSSNTELPEVTIVYVSGCNTACWSSDGKICGNPYFFEEGTITINADHFYKQYIDPFIQHILQHETTTKNK